MLALGVRNTGIVAIGVNSLEIVFVIDAKKLIEVELAQEVTTMSVAATNFLSKSTLTILIDTIGIFVFKLEYRILNPSLDDLVIEMPHN